MRREEEARKRTGRGGGSAGVSKGPSESPVTTAPWRFLTN